MGNTHSHTHLISHKNTHAGQNSIVPTCLSCFFSHFSSWRYLPFNSIKTFKQANWKQLAGKIKLHKQNYSDRLRLILGIWALLGSSNNSTSTRGGQGRRTIFCCISFDGPPKTEGGLCVCGAGRGRGGGGCAPHNRAVFIYPLLEREQALNPNRS